LTSHTATKSTLLRQQVAIARFGSFALRTSNVSEILHEAARVCADGLNSPFCKVCRYRADENDLLIEAGYGWRSGVVGKVVSRADASSPQGHAFTTGMPSICRDVRRDTKFVLPPFYADHGIISTVDVLIKGDHQPYGVLEVDNNRHRNYNQNDIEFLTGFANVLAEVVAAAARTAELRSTIAQMESLAAEKDRLLEQRNVFAEELKHRVRNNLQLVYGMLTHQLEDPASAASLRGIRAIALRVSTMAQVFDHLLGTEMTRTTDFGRYVKALCTNLAEIQGSPSDTVSLICESEKILLDLDSVTALGIIVTELVTNCYDHAFSDAGGTGVIRVAVRRDEGNADRAILTVGDNGSGIKPGSLETKRHGVGLVRRLAEQIRGTVSVTSEGGTMWSVQFPIQATRNVPVGG